MRTVTAALLLTGAIAFAQQKAPQVPRPAAEFSINMPENKPPVLLSQYRGKVTVVEFLLTTCPHCQSASQLMSKLQTEYGPKGFQAVGIAFNDMANMLIPAFVRDFKVNYPVGYASREPIYNFLQADSRYSIHVPQIVIIDKKGMIRHQSLPREDTVTATEKFLRTTIEPLLKESATGPVKTSKKPAAKKASS